jgi:hypothetical protein
MHQMTKGANSGNRVAVEPNAIVLTEKKMIEAENGVMK